VKIKKVAEADVVLMGAVPGSGKHTGQIGALIVGQYRHGTRI